MTEWRSVPGYDLYEVSSDGDVRRKPAPLKPGAIPTGHLTVNMRVGSGKSQSMYVHRLVALAFLANPDDKRVVNHKNGNPKDNRLENLEWSTHSENNTHAWRVNGRRSTKEVGVRGCDPTTGEVMLTFESMADAARHLNVTPRAVRSAVLREGACCGYVWSLNENA